MYNQSKFTADEPSSTYSVNGADWREAIRGMQIITLFKHQTMTDKPASSWVEFRPMAERPMQKD
jgi:hypothetical protein